MARSTRMCAARPTAAATRITTAPRISHFRGLTRVSGLMGRRSSRGLRRSDGWNRLHGDAWRRHVVLGDEEIGHQGHRAVNPVALEVHNAAGMQDLVVDTELAGELTRRFCENRVR